MALGDLVVGDVHQPNLGLLVPGLAAEDLDKTAGDISVWEEEEEEEFEKAEGEEQDENEAVEEEDKER